MEEKETIKASRKTANLLRVKKDFYKVSEELYKALLDIFGDEQGESIYESEYESILRELDIKLDTRIMDRINNEISRVENKEELSI